MWLGDAGACVGALPIVLVCCLPLRESGAGLGFMRRY